MRRQLLKLFMFSLCGAWGYIAAAKAQVPVIPDSIAATQSESQDNIKADDLPENVKISPKNPEMVDEIDSSVAEQFEQSGEDLFKTAASAAETVDDNAPKEPEAEVQLEVFPLEFMNSLLECKPAEMQRDDLVMNIVGVTEDKCRIKYGNYELNVPTTLLANIHSFDDLEVLLKNKDIARYKYLPKYVYSGLIYALEACSRQKDYYGTEERETLPDAFIVRGLSAKYRDKICYIYLENELNLDLEGSEVDYGFTCRLEQGAVDELMPYFTDILAANSEPEDINAERPKAVRDADIALMYYLQQNGYCAKNQQQTEAEGEN